MDFRDGLAEHEQRISYLENLHELPLAKQIEEERPSMTETNPQQPQVTLRQFQELQQYLIQLNSKLTYLQNKLNGHLDKKRKKDIL